MDLTELLLSLFLAAGVTPWAFFWPECPCCPTCDYCTAGVPTDIQVDLSGIADSICTDCEKYNGSFVVTKVDEPLLPTTCVWRYDFPDQCDGWNARLQVELNNSFLSVRLRFTNVGVRDVLWGLDSPDDGDSYHCHAWSSFALPFTSGTLHCTGVGTTAYLTAL